MKILKTKWYLYRITGLSTGLIRDKPLNAKMDGKLILASYKHAYQGWRVGKGSKLATMTEESKIKWEAI